MVKKTQIIQFSDKKKTDLNHLILPLKGPSNADFFL